MGICLLATQPCYVKFFLSQQLVFPKYVLRVLLCCERGNSTNRKIASKEISFVTGNKLMWGGVDADDGNIDWQFWKATQENPSELHQRIDALSKLIKYSEGVTYSFLD